MVLILLFRCSRYYNPKPPCDPSPAVTEAEDDLKSGSICLTVESLTDCESTTVELDLGELFPDLEIPTAGSTASMVIDPPAETGSSRFLLDPAAALAERLQPPPPVSTQNGPTNHSDCKLYFILIFKKKQKRFIDKYSLICLYYLFNVRKY